MRHEVELDDRVQDAAELVGRRLVLLDLDRRPVAWSIHESELDRRRLSAVLAQSSAWPAPARDAGYVRVSGIGTVALVPVAAAHGTVAYLATVLAEGEAALPAADADRLHEASRPLVPALRARRRRELGGRASPLVRGLIDGDPDAARAVVAESLLSDSARYCAVALAGPDGSVERTEQAVDAVLGFVHESSTASVIGGMSTGGVGVMVFPRPVVVQRLARLLDHPRSAGIRAGIGPVVTGLPQVPDSFARAVAILRATLALPGTYPVVATAADVGVDAWLAAPRCTRADLPAGIAALLDEPTLFATADSYLAAGGNAQDCARRLHIHRSTLYYRLERITSLLGGPLDADASFEVATWIRLARLGGLVT